MDRSGIVVPTLRIARIGVLEIMLHGKEHDAGGASQRHADDVYGKKQRSADEPRHHYPCAQQPDVIPKYMPILCRRFPTMRFKLRGARLDGYAGLRDFVFNQMPHQADAALKPRKTRVKNQIDKASKRGEPNAACPPVHALLLAGDRGVFVDRQDVQRATVFLPIAVCRMVIGIEVVPQI